VSTAITTASPTLTVATPTTTLSNPLNVVSESIISPEHIIKHTPSYTSILTSPNRLKDVKAKLAAPIPVGELELLTMLLININSNISQI
jgi:hypothetical protein